MTVTSALVPTNDTSIHATATEEFARILHAEEISLLVSTDRIGRVALIRASSPARLELTLRPFLKPFGIAIGDDRIVIGTQSEVCEFRKDDDRFLPRATWDTGAIHVHEIAFAGDELWIVNTLYSSLCTFDEQHNLVPRWRPSFIETMAPDDSCHLNGLAVSDGRVKLVTAFCDSADAEGWRQHLGEGILIDVDSGEIALRNLAVPHSPRLHDGTVFVLESWKGTMAVADLARGSVEEVIGLPGFTRGLAFVGPYALVGVSQVQPGRTDRKIPLFDRFDDTESGVWAIDLRTGRAAGFLRFESGIGEVMDVQVLPG